MTIETENTDSRLISFKDGFNFDENYQEWSTNVSKRLWNDKLNSSYFYD